MQDASWLTVQEAAVRLHMTPQGVRKAVREHRLRGTAELLPSGKRYYRVPEDAVTAYLARAVQGHGSGSQSDAVSMRLELTTQALQDREIEVVELKARLEVVELKTRLEAVEAELKRTKDALSFLVRTLTGDGETQRRTTGGTA